MADFSAFTTKPKRKKKKGRRSDSFFESLRDIGSSITTSIKDDVIKGTARGIHDQVVGADSSIPTQEQQPDFDFAEYIKVKEAEAEEKGREEEKSLQQHHRKQEKVVFSFVDEKLKQEIDAVRQELKLVIEAIDKKSQQVEKAIVEEIVNPGTYHLNYFVKLRVFLNSLRKSLNSGELWQEMWSSRSSRSHFWKMSKKKGTQYMLSEERKSAFHG